MTWTVATGAATAVIVIVVGLVLVLGAPVSFRSSATLVVLPGPEARNPSFYRALAGGEVPAGFASATTAIADAQGGNGTTSVVVTLAPQTGALTVVATAGTPAAAAVAANGVADGAVRELGTSRPPFVLVPVSRAEPADTRPVGTASWIAVAIVMSVAAAACSAVAQATWLWWAFGQRRREMS